MQTYSALQLRCACSCCYISNGNTLCRLQVVLQHTASQKADLLFLRRRFFGKIKQLASQRSSLMQRMSNIEAEHLRDGERHEKLAELSAQLKQNGQEDYRTHIHFTAVMYEGVSALCCHTFKCTSSAVFWCDLQGLLLHTFSFALQTTACISWWVISLHALAVYPHTVLHT